MESVAEAILELARQVGRVATAIERHTGAMSDAHEQGVRLWLEANGHDASGEPFRTRRGGDPRRRF